MVVLVLPVPGSKIVVKSRSVKKKCEKSAGEGEKQGATPHFPKSSRKSYFRFIRFNTSPLYYCIWEPGTGYFWLGAQSYKGGRGQRTARRLGREQRETDCKDGGLFWVVCTPAYGSFRLNMNIRLSRSFARVLRSFLRLRRAGPPDKAAVLRNIKLNLYVTTWPHANDTPSNHFTNATTLLLNPLTKDQPR